mmetsp:Transcript_87118/g.198852  ORF Transcript_87118/g.198852 Transcript_87118/m.198852 type:complete len:350 (-) Transcript_87118:167-1216(-)
MTLPARQSLGGIADLLPDAIFVLDDIGGVVECNMEGTKASALCDGDILRGLDVSMEVLQEDAGKWVAGQLPSDAGATGVLRWFSRSDTGGVLVVRPTGGGGPQDIRQLESELELKQGEVGDLLADVRHLQVDLEYHQTKLDSVLEEKSLMLGELSRLQQEILEARRLVEDKDQALKHQEIDLKTEQSKTRFPQVRGAGLEELQKGLAALREEVKTKDGALLFAHLELHKERKLREKYEEKTNKLSDRMQKLMLIAENQRKEITKLERIGLSKDQQMEKKQRQHAEAHARANHLHSVLSSNSRPSARLPASFQPPRSRSGSATPRGGGSLHGSMHASADVSMFKGGASIG